MDPLPQHVASAGEIPLAHRAEPLAYARYGTVTPAQALAAKRLVWLASLSGVCVGVCFLPFISSLGIVPYLGVFGWTLVAAFRAGSPLHGQGPAPQARNVLDVLALLGLLGIALSGPLAFAIERPVAWFYALAFLALAATTYRHRLLYRLLSSWARDAMAPALAKSLTVLGVIKTFYEALWLAACSATAFCVAAEAKDDPTIFFAFAALVGVAGYLPIWIWMIVAHARLASVLGRASRTV
jgi:hypothetical protein